ncbi:MAG: transcription-repair coupling factor [Candidatus Schekmanbacteria bacterium RBG_13_48_7]|uniref:Transcription-repair-coupling factor n=1 Tax=Candidatus Schekmanbacteria bacterium RBG_13_48_7 TaxID=1817878 RepID=A0A1F7S6R5_9BACT|nr:MAG: transcription-repair coupling factor [Candidatus Schekmanbacteria bacterium RBG_13_48_7]
MSVTGLLNSGWGLFLATAVNQTGKRILVITPGEEDAQKISTDTKFFLKTFFSDSIPDKKPIIAEQTDIIEELPGIIEPVMVLPAWDTLPFEDLSPGIESISQRIAILSDSLNKKHSRIIFTSINSFAQFTVSPDIHLAHSRNFEIFQHTDMEKFKENLVELGYKSVNRVEEKCEFTSRGGILDVFIPLYRNPVRIEFFGDEITDLREFDPVTQRSTQKIFQFSLIPAKEFLTTREMFKTCIEKIRSKQDSLGLDEQAADEIIEKFGITAPFEGIERWLPFMVEKTGTMLDYMESGTLIAVVEPEHVHENLKLFLEDAYFEYRKVLKMGIPVPEVEEMYLSGTELQNLLQEHSTLNLEEFIPEDPSGSETNIYRFKNRSIPSFTGRPKELFNIISEAVKRGEDILICCHGEDQIIDLENRFIAYENENILHLLDHSITHQHAGQNTGQITMLVGELSGGFSIPEIHLTVISAVEIFGEKRIRKQKQRKLSSESFSSLSDLKIGDYIVHFNHGIGRYLGIKLIQVGDVEKDFISLEYADGDKLYVPIDRLNLVQRYLSGEQHHPTLDKLGAKNWDKIKQKIKKSIRDMTQELLKLYAQRKLLKGHAYSQDIQWQREFEAGFEYVETDDQLLTIESVKKDMESESMMDRLICGDVGFGKTEVAMRAAFKAINDNKQVAILVPTTVLAHQHYQNFKKRFQPFPISVEMLSRFRKPKEQKAIIGKLKVGAIDLVIGTHRLLSKDIEFKDLGLLIIDEEHRFGVAQKEKIKQLRNQIDILMMTATPIPRTLNMSLMGIRDISIINTPPKDRLAIHTQIIKFDPKFIREVIMRELNRGGQVYFVHNRIQSIATVAEYLSNWVPEARTAVAHGQMDEKHLEKIMIDFMEKKFDVLLCTAIIESGLDIPNVNTILINRADKFGLAQLYQLRGRVGRDRYQAFAYLLVPDKRTLTTVAKRRLSAIQELNELGSGFRLATYDMDIRGTGNLLGREQHGHIKAVGFDLYCQLLEETVQELQGKPVEQEIEPNLNLPVNAFIPKNYINDINQRLLIYRKISTIKSTEDMSDLRTELTDCYGSIPDSINNLLSIMDIKRICISIKIESLDMQKDTLIMVFHSNARFQQDSFARYIARKSPKLVVVSAKKFMYRLGNLKDMALLNRITEILTEFESLKELSEIASEG